MLKKILLVLDNGDSAEMARDHALQLAKKHKAEITGLALIDAAPLQEGEAMPMGTYSFREARNARLEQSWLDNAQALLDAARGEAELQNVALTGMVGEDETPEAVLLKHAPLHDLLVVSTDSHLGDAARLHDVRWLENYLQDPIRPLMLFTANTRSMLPGRCVLLAYDGSPCAARALQQFVFLGIGHDLPRLVLTNHEDPKEAERLAREGVAYLASHGLTAEPLALSVPGAHAEILMSECDTLGAALLVMGAFGHNSWKERLFGSTTRTLMKSSHVPLLMFH